MRDSTRTLALRDTIIGLTWLLAIWALWAASYTVWPARPGPQVLSNLTAALRRRRTLRRPSRRQP